MTMLTRDAAVVKGGKTGERRTEKLVIGKESVVRQLEKGWPPAQYMIDVDIEKCIGCQMCMVDCAAHHADPLDLPVAYPKSWELLPESRLLVDALSMDRKGRVAQKCDMCIERFEAGLEPVCVQICPRGALTVRPVQEPADRKERLTLIELKKKRGG